jgi:hypothetical protein
MAGGIGFQNAINHPDQDWLGPPLEPASPLPPARHIAAK